MTAIQPQSVNPSTETEVQTSKIPSLVLDRLSECGRLCVQNGLISYAEGVVNVTQRASQCSLRSQIWNEYTKAELLLRKPPTDVDPKTGMKLNSLQI